MSAPLPAWLLQTRPDLAQQPQYGAGDFDVPAGFNPNAGTSLDSQPAQHQYFSGSLNRNMGYVPAAAASGASAIISPLPSSSGYAVGGSLSSSVAASNFLDGARSIIMPQQQFHHVEGQQTLRVPPGPRTFGLVDPPRRALYRLMVRQLLSDGFADAAMAVVRSTGVVVGNPGAEPQKLLDLVQTGASASRLLSNGNGGSSSSQGGATGGGGGSGSDLGLIEDVIYSADPYSLCQLPPVPSAFDYREWYTSKSFDRPVRCAAFDNTGGVVAVGTGSGEVRLYSVQLADEYARSASAAELQNPSDAALIRAMPGLHLGYSVEAVALHPRHPIVISGGRDGRLSFTRYSTQFGSSAAAASAATALSSSNLVGHRTVATHHDTFAVRSVALHPGGDVVLFGTDHNVPRLYQIETGTVFAPAGSMRNMDNMQSFQQQESSDYPGAAGAVRPRSAHEQYQMRQQRDNDPTSVHIGSITDVAYAPDGRCFGTASFDGNMRFYDGRLGSEVAKYNYAHCGVAVTSLCFSRSGYVVLSAGLDSQIRLWDLRKPSGGSEVASFCSTGGVPVKQRVQCRARACFSADEHSILTTNADFTGILHVDGSTMKAMSSIDYWASSSGQQQQHQQASGKSKSDAASGSMSAGTGVVRTVVSSPARTLLAAGGDDMRLRLWAPLIVAKRDH